VAKERLTDPEYNVMPFLLSNGDIGLQYSSLVISFAALAAAPWIPWSRRFSLRTLLIAMTVMAVATGVIVAVNR
jgi:hypothetical protein